MTKRIAAILATLFVVAQMSPVEGQTVDAWLGGPDAEELTGNGTAGTPPEPDDTTGPPPHEPDGTADWKEDREFDRQEWAAEQQRQEQEWEAEQQRRREEEGEHFDEAAYQFEKGLRSRRKDVLEFTFGFVEDIFPESGSTKLRIGTPPAVVVTATTEYVDELGGVVDPSTIPVGSPVSAAVWWASAGESEAYKVYVGEEPLSSVPLLSFPFGGFVTRTDGSEVMEPLVVEFVALDLTIPVSFDGVEGTRTFDSVAADELLDHEAELWFVVDGQGVNVLEEIHVYALEEVPDPFWDMFVDVYEVDEERCTLVLFHEPFVVDATTDWGGIDPQALVEGTELVLEVDSEFHLVRAQLKDPEADYAHLFTGELGVYFGGFVSLADVDGQQVLRVYDAELESPVALDLLVRDDATGDVVTGGLSAVTGSVRARVVHPQPGSHLPFNLIIEIGLNAEEEPPPPPVDTGPELVAGFVEFLELDVSGTGTLQLRSLNQIALQPGIEFDPSTVEPGTPLTLGLCWASTGEAETFRVIVGGGEFEAGLPTLDAEFGGFETLPDGRLAINIAEVDLAVPPQALVTLPESTEAVPFSSVSIDAVLGHRVELWLVDELVEEVVVFPLEEDPALMDPYWDLLFTVYTADSTTWTLYGENPRFTADTQTVWEDGVSGIVDPLTVAEGTPLVFQVDAAGRVVRVELLQSDVDPIHLFEDPKLEVWEGNFIDLVAGVFRTSEIFPTPVASDLVVLDELTGDDLTQGGLAQVAGFVRARALHPPLGSLLPDGLIVEIGLNAAEPVDFIDHRGGVVSFVELDGSGARGQLHLAAIKPVLLNSETGFQDAAGSSFDPAALELDEELGVVAWWTSAGDPLAVTVFRGGLPLGLSGFEMPFNGIQDLEDGTQALLAGQIEFDVSADAIIAIGDAELSLTDAVTLGELAVGSEVDLWLTESAAGEVQVTEVQVLANTLPAAEVEPFWDVFGTVYQVNEEICTLVLLNDPFTVDDATLYEDELGGVLASTDLLPGVALVIQVAFETDRVVRAQIEQEGADYSHLFDDPEVGVVFGNFLGFVDDLLLTSDPYQPSVAVDALIVNEETGEDVTATVGLSGLSGEFVRARILHPPPELVIPVDLVVQFGVNVVFDDLEDPVDPTAEGPNANALLSLDLDPNLADQGLVHLQASAGGTIQLAIYASEVIDVTGMSVDVSYDPAQLAFEGASREAAGDANVLASSAIFLAPRVGEGTIKYTGIVLGDGGTATGELRSGLLAVLEFTPLDLSRADLVLERVVLNSAEGTDTLEPGLVARVVRLATGIADFNGDGFVEWNDLFRFADAWLDDDFDPIFDLNGDGSLDELDLFIFAPQWGRQVDVVAKVLARPELPQQGELQLEITSIDDEAVELLLSVDEARVLGYGASVRFDANAFRLKAINDVRPEAVSADRQTLLSLQRPGEVLFVGGSLSSAGVQGALARFEFERLSPEATGSFQIADAALRSSDGTTVRPLRSSGAEIRSLPQAFSLDRNYPNPFNPSTTIPYRLASASTVELEIFDIAGRKVRTVLAEIQEAGFRETTWDGRDEDGHVVGAGVYFYRLTALPTLNGDDGNGEFVAVRKLMLLK